MKWRSKCAVNQSGLSSLAYSRLDTRWVRPYVEFRYVDNRWTSLTGSGRLEAEAVDGERVQAVIKGGASPKPSVLTIGSAFCRLPISAEPVSCSLRSSLATNDAPATF